MGSPHGGPTLACMLEHESRRALLVVHLVTLADAANLGRTCKAARAVPVECLRLKSRRWSQHANMAMFTLLLSRAPKTWAWIDVIACNATPATRNQMLEEAVHYGEDVAVRVFHSGALASAEGALVAATIARRRGVCALLLEHGAAPCAAALKAADMWPEGRLLLLSRCAGVPVAPDELIRIARRAVCEDGVRALGMVLGRLELGQDPDADWCSTVRGALTAAASHGCADAVRLLLDRCGEAARAALPAAIEAAAAQWWRQGPVVRLLLESGAPLTADALRALIQGDEAGDEACDALVLDGVRRGARCDGLLSLAAERGWEELAAVLLDARPAPSLPELSAALQKAALHGYRSLCERLLRAGAPCHSDEACPAFAAYEGGHTELGRALTSGGGHHPPVCLSRCLKLLMDKLGHDAECLRLLGLLGPGAVTNKLVCVANGRRVMGVDLLRELVKHGAVVDRVGLLQCRMTDSVAELWKVLMSEGQVRVSHVSELEARALRHGRLDVLDALADYGLLTAD